MNELNNIKAAIIAATVGIGNQIGASLNWIDTNISKIVAYLSLVVMLLTIRRLISQWRKEFKEQKDD